MSEFNTPLHVVPYLSAAFIADTKGRAVTPILDPKLAAHIVLCANSHDALVDALTLFVQHFGDPFRCARAALNAVEVKK